MTESRDQLTLTDVSPDDVFVCCVGSMCVGLGPAGSAN